ncbi:MAG: ABC transporter ATP-binding protein [Legionellales bacterium RIFCSPHIGHO2_12_FULL_42_9]|nr:MAG: ABC transporter ATP-binding protein [Legionellales bacterium RIFCSPHIGHO2_12_FULL_42_9]
MTRSAKIEHLSVAFQTNKKSLLAVDSLDFSLHAGETLALLGESGCGKSLTALALMRLLPLRTVYDLKSRIWVDETDLLDLPESMMRQIRGRRLSIIFQEPMTSLNPVLRIDEQLAEAVLQHQCLSRHKLHERMLELLHEVELTEPELKLRQYPHQLSGGQKQRVVIAMALANDPEILIADEPTTALDATIQAQILALLKSLQKNYQMSMLLITHDLGVVKSAADRVCLMYAGQIVLQSTVSEFFSRELHPYAQQLVASRPSFSKRLFRLDAIPGAVPSLDELPTGCRFHPRCAHAFPLCATHEPLLQQIDNRLIRCHLYPEHTDLSALTSIAERRTARVQQDEILLEVNNLCVNFELQAHFLGRKQIVKAVDGLSFQIKKGKTLALVGESGCGKTTTSRAILRLVPISCGDIRYRGKQIEFQNRHDAIDYRKKVQVVFQDPYSSLNPRMTVDDLIAEGMVAQGVSSQRIQKKLKSLMSQVGLPLDALSRYPHQFSGGQRQRICIARALAIEPEIIICDEPTSALDISVQAQILNLLKDLQDEFGVSYLFITHNMAVVSYLADDVLVMREGRCVEFDSCEAIFHHPQHDYTRRLLGSILV